MISGFIVQNAIKLSSTLELFISYVHVLTCCQRRYGKNESEGEESLFCVLVYYSYIHVCSYH